LYSQNVNLIDSFEYLFSGNEANESVNFRIEQYEEIKNRIFDSPITGKGFGYFNPNYSTYSELSKPYLLEMDMLNFISKIGLPLFIVYIFSYILLYFFITKIKDRPIQKLFKLYFWCLIAFILYSFGQTLHQSYIYWFVYSIIASSIISTLNNQNKFSYNV
jgi:O-antigen ligase